MNHKLKIKLDNPLNTLDSVSQTYGCRHKDPEFCKYIDTDECAFKRKDEICKKPSSSWKKSFKMLTDLNSVNS